MTTACGCKVPEVGGRCPVCHHYPEARGVSVATLTQHALDLLEDALGRGHSDQGVSEMRRDDVPDGRN